MRRSAPTLLTIVGYLVLFAAPLHAQTIAARPDRGTMPNATYSVSDIENINLQNGNVSLSIPLASLPPIAGGKLSWSINAYYNSKPWDIPRQQLLGQTFGYHPYVVDTPQVANAGGWRITDQYILEIREAHVDFDYQAPASGDPDYTLVVNNTWYKVMLRTPDGAEHELRPTDFSSFSGNTSFLKGYYKETPFTHGTMRYYSYDGSHLFATVSGVNDWTVYTPDGTKVVQTTDGIQRIQDTNGNKIKIYSDSNGTHYKDEQSGREIRYYYNPSGNGGNGQGQVFYETVGGVSQHIDINFGSTTVQGLAYRVKDWEPGATSECQHYEWLNENLSVVREIVLPQTEPSVTRKFLFEYNSDASQSKTTLLNFTCNNTQNYTRDTSLGWGSLSKMTMPSGAAVFYTYNLDAFDLVLGTDDMAGQKITHKKLTHDGTDEDWDYSIITDTSTITNPDGSTITEKKIGKNPAMSSGVGKSGLVYRSTHPFTKIERHWIDLPFSGADVNSPGGALDFNSVVDAEYTTIMDAGGAELRMSAKLFQYDYNGNLTQTTEYDWFDPTLVTRDTLNVPTGVPAGATVLRVTSNSHYNQAGSSTSSNVYAKRSVSGTPLILNAPKETTVGPSNVQFSYDGQAYGVAPTIGNLTSQSVWDDVDNKPITTSKTYDVYGNVATATDARLKITQFTYGDSTHALPTSITVDPQNGTGTQTTTTAYDQATSLVTSQTDANGQVTDIYYTNQLLGTVDPFGRPGITKSPAITIGAGTHRRRVTTTYLDSSRQMIVATDLNAEDDKLLKTRTTMDQLGRPTLTETTEDGANYTISVRKAYLKLGQATLTSSPMRSTAAATDSWTRVTNDLAGRVVEVATFGGATQPAWTGTAGTFTGLVTTAYSANFTTVTDQAGKVRRSMTDALGRLVRVDEPDANNSLGTTASPVQPTSYGYDVLGNLLSVTQGSQTRTFTYDSLSRLRSAVNPESGTITYQYDDNSNLIVKTDPRSVSAHYEYDALNRVIRRWYNGSGSTSNTQHNVPALPSSVGATDEVKFYYDALLPIGAPSYTVGTAKGRLTAQTYGSGTTGDYYGYDVLGRAKIKIQRTGAKDYDMAADYSLSGAVTSMIYPSGHTITNTFDQIGRLTGFSGNLGDGATRTYATGISYSSLGGMLKEQFGTNTPVYHKLHYNSRSQLCDIRASNVNDDWGGELGALVNYYSTPYAVCGNGSDNNGNLLMSQTIINSFYIEDRYTYDSLNRLKSVGEYQNGTTNTGNQTYDYDRWGNRINLTANGTGINNTSFEIESATNRIYAPGDLALADASRKIRYDAAGNQKQDTYTGAGSRTYDAENKITSAAAAGNQTATYVYDATGQRIKRTANGVETWQVYGFGGELLAEYPANGDKLTPQKEYGYRNSELLITAEPAPTSALGPNLAAASNGAVATASSTYSGVTASNAINGDHVGSSSWWTDNTTSSYPDWVQVDFSGSKTISEIDVFGLQQNYGSPAEPTSVMTSSYALTSFEVQYWTGSAWATVPSATVSGNNKVWNKFSFAPLTTSKIRVYVTNVAGDNHSQIVEIEAYGPVNLAAASNGATATASSTYPTVSASNAINGDHVGTASWWADNTTSAYPDWVQVDFSSSKTINEIDVFGLHQNPGSPTEPTLTMTSSYALSNFEVQYWTGSAWATVPGATVSSNDKVWNKFTFAPLTTSKIRVYVTNVSGDNHSQIVEIEAYYRSTSQTQWLISDHLGTPRMIIDQTGTLANVKRHDYLPFGEELFAPSGGRTSSLGYTTGDGVRQQFTSKERDVDTGLDYFGARYFSNTQSRFIVTDPITVTSENFLNPQRWDLYTYVNNNPLAASDPTGGDGQGKGGDKVITVFLNISASQSRDKIVNDKKEVIGNAPSPWPQTQREAAENGYKVVLFGSPEMTGAPGLPDPYSFAKFYNMESGLKNSQVFVYVGHGAGTGAGTDESPFVQEGLTVDSAYLQADGNHLLFEGHQTDTVMDKPETTASVILNFSCDASRAAGNYFNFTGSNQVMVTINSGKNGVTNASTIEKAAVAFVNTYAKTGGDYQKAAAAANKVITDSAETVKSNRGDSVEVKKVN